METVNTQAQAITTQGENMSVLAANVGGATATAQLAKQLVEERQGSYEDIKSLHEQIVELTDTNATLTEKLAQATLGAEKVKLVIAQESRYGENEKIVKYEATPAVLDLLKPVVTAELDKKYKNAVTENIMLKDQLAVKDSEKESAVIVAKKDLQRSHMETLAEIRREHSADLQDMENSLSKKDIEIANLRRQVDRLQNDKDYANLEKENLKLREVINNLSRKFINFSAIAKFFTGK